ncbi:MAG: ABC transporter substrate-binding protein [Firmicutes bacterium]|nr:ABC transporter substrate-binding protein [Bacillota bacterium]
MRKQIWSSIAVLGLAFTLVFALAGASLAAKEVTVRLSGWSSSPAEQKLVDDAIKSFEAKYPDIQVKYEPVVDTGQFPNKLKTMLASGTAPDVFYVDMSEAPGLMTRGLLSPLDKLMPSTKTKPEDFLSTLLEAFTYQGKIYGIPKDFNTLGLFYNKEMFDAAGVPYPTPDWTWEDLRAAAKKLTRDTDDPAKAQYGICLPIDAARWLPFLYQNGGAVLNAAGTKSLLDSEATVKALDFYTGFQLKEKTGVRNTDVGAGWGGDAFGKGKTAMVLEGGWLIPYLTQSFPNIKYGVVELPKGPKGRGNLYFTVAYAISGKSKNPEAAWKLIEHLTGAENQQKVLHSGFALPTRKALENDRYFQENPNIAAIFQGYAYARPFQYGVNSGRVLDELGKMLERVFLGKATPRESVSEAGKKIEELLK